MRVAKGRRWVDGCCNIARQGSNAKIFATGMRLSASCLGFEREPENERNKSAVIGL